LAHGQPIIGSIGHIRIGDTVQATLAHILDKTDFKVTRSFTGSNLSQQARRSYITNASK